MADLRRILQEQLYFRMAAMRFDATLILWYIYSYKEVVRDDRKQAVGSGRSLFDEFKQIEE